MNVIQVPVNGLTATSIINLVPKGKGILFVGSGCDTTPQQILLSSDYKVMCNDLDHKPPYFTGEWVKGDVLSLNYESINKDYKAIVSKCLCNGVDGRLIKDCVYSGKWRNFDYIAIEFCHNEECYNPRSNLGKLSTAFNINSAIKSMNFNTQLFNGGQGNSLDLMLMASKHSLPKTEDLFPADSDIENKLSQLLKYFLISKRITEE